MRVNWLVLISGQPVGSYESDFRVGGEVLAACVYLVPINVGLPLIGLRMANNGNDERQDKEHEESIHWERISFYRPTRLRGYGNSQRD